MASLREKAAAAGLGNRRPSWENLGLGRADREPDAIIRGLNASGFMGTGDDWITDVTRLLSMAVQSPVLSGLYSSPLPQRSANSVMITGASDLTGYSPAVMRRMIMSTLWAAELTGRIALPTRLAVRITSDQRSLQITV